MKLRLKFSKLLILSCAIAFALLSCASSFAASGNDEAYSKLAEDQTIMTEATNALKAGNDELRAAESKLKALEVKKQTSKTKREKSKLERQITSLNNKITSLEKDIAAKEHEIELLKAKLQGQTKDSDSAKVVDINNVKSWHKEAKAQIIDWNFKPGDKAVKITVLYRKTRKTAVAEAKFTTKKGDKFFLIDALPEGLQVVMPDDSEGTWTVNVHSGKGFVSKIEDPDNITGSKLNANSNKDEYGGKTFKSGEAFIILKQSGMTIRPPIY